MDESRSGQAQKGNNDEKETNTMRLAMICEANRI
jgi:hypothetical protein